MPRKRHRSDDDLNDDNELESEGLQPTRENEDDDEEDGDEDTIDLEEAEEEEEAEAAEDEDETLIKESVEDLEKKRLFLSEAEEALESLTLDEIREVLKDNEMDPKLASRLKKLLSEVVEEGEVTSMEDAWGAAIEKLDEES